MEKCCEFCMALRPVIYCKADAAHLCLCCDAKVHSANALSNRHSRTLVCESCSYRPACVRCSDHKMFICRGCDQSLHEDPSRHQKRVISSYIGCPSAKDLASLWGFDLNELDSNALPSLFVFEDQVNVNCDIPRQSLPQVRGFALASKVNSTASIFCAESEVGSSNQNSKQQNTRLILQQIIDLKRLQLTEDSNPTLIRGQAQTNISSSEYDKSQNIERNLDQHLQHSLGHGADLLQMDSPHQELNVEPFPLPFSQLEHLIYPSAVGNSLNEDIFWQCKSPVQNGQLWSQNMQDLGVCEEMGFFDDFNIPNLDLTFRNFEELFGGDQDPTSALPDDKDNTCSSTEKDTVLDRSYNDYAVETEDTSVTSSVYITRSSHADKDAFISDQDNRFSRSGDFPCSTLSFSLSRLSAESSDTGYMDSILSPIIAGQELPYNFPDLGCKEKKKGRLYEKQIRYASGKARADAQKRV
ncbi:putative zinc finger protein At1g68190 isoform X2 [Cornus florida]|uniref:putative zinc finger protein At1g68190 isoform X2 n=1 Tax=Cornus florida TaxID=4283 RepID=UPI00289FFC8E|nr:putative zinc finger protein At1g68190 isoform X2 [Cornus florida]